ncbi:ABC transporter permease [Bacillus sp. C1]
MYHYCEECNEYQEENHDCCKKRDKKCDKKRDKKRKKRHKCDEDSSKIDVKVNCCCDDHGKNLVRASAFRAVSNVDQNLPANTLVKVLFQNEQFDLANEYNPATSVFIPKTDGVYSIIGTVAFGPNDLFQDYNTTIEIRVNGGEIIVSHNTFFGGGVFFLNDVTVTTILELQAGDMVEIFAQSNQDGVIFISDGVTRFEAARYPSPLG